MTRIPAKLLLSNGMSFNGYSFGHTGSVSGEVVFNTAMTGYPESLTDPSYRGQILVLTYPLIGNYGVPDKVSEAGLPAFFESEQIHVSGLVISSYSEQYSHWNADRSLASWLAVHSIPAIEGIDTRALTQIIREHGAMTGKIVVDGEEVNWRDPNSENLVAEVSTKEVIRYGNGRLRILLVDLGVKYNIIRHFLKRDTTVIRVPWDYDFSNPEYDGLFL
jgi:carbamoyl-phosphate synthase small subunit